MSTASTLVPRVVVFSVFCAASGCTDEEQRSDPPNRDRALIGAFAATDPALAAVGAVALVPMTEDVVEPPVVVCTGTLIGPSTVVTAKHCLDAPIEFGGTYRLVFLLGADGNAPTAQVDVLAFEGAPDDYGGYNGYGADVGVLHLREPVPDVAPMSLGGVQNSMIGTDFLAVGYGAIDSSQAYGTRRVGNIKLKATSGPTYEALLGSFQAFFEFESSQPLSPDCAATDGTLNGLLQSRSAQCETTVALRAVFDAFRLETVGEVAAGGYAGDAQPCSGDSGGPLLLRRPDGKLAAYGVVSGGLASRSQQCAYGAIYASFSPAVLTFLQTALRWTDPCSDLPAAGQCAGNTARRCTTSAEGPRVALSFDCGRVGATCAMQADGMVGCGGDPARDIAAPPVLTSRSSEALVRDPLMFGRRVFRAPGERPPQTKP